MSEFLDKVLEDMKIGEDGHYLDLDTFKDSTSGKSVRLGGVDAAETIKINEDGTIRDFGTAGNVTQDAEYKKLLKARGFGEIARTGDAAFNRDSGELVNEEGDDASSYLLRHGLMNPVTQANDKQMAAYEYGKIFRDKLDREDPEAAEARRVVENAMREDGYDPLNLKEVAVNNREVQRELAALKAGGMDEATAKRKMKSKYSESVMFDEKDRNFYGEAFSPVSESWDTGVLSVIESGFGAAALLGDTIGSESLMELGEAGAYRAKDEAYQNASFLSSYKDVDDFGDAAEFLGTNMAMSLPYMGAIVAGSFAGPLGLAGVGSLYAGGIYNDQEVKNVAVAWAGGALQATLDKAGLDVLLKSGPPKQMFAQALAAMTKKGIPEKAATAQLLKISRLELAKMATDGAKLASQQLAKKKVAMDILANSIKGGGSESVTESLQELIGYAASHNYDKSFDWNEATEHMIHAAIAGGSLGSIFSASGTVADKAMWRDAAWKLDSADPEAQTQAAKLHEDEKAYYARQDKQMPDVDELTRKAGRAAEFVAEQPDFSASGGLSAEEFSEIQSKGLNAFEDIEKKNKSQRSFQDKVLDAISLVPKAFQGHLSMTFGAAAQVKYRAARELAGMFGSGTSKVYSGETYENFKHHAVTKYKTYLPTPERTFKAMGINFSNKKQKTEVSDEFYRQAQAAVDPDTGNLNPELFPEGPNKAIFQRLAADMVMLGDTMYSDQLNVDPNLGYVENYLLRYKAFDKAAIDKDRALFVDNLMAIEGLDISRADANAITERIIEDGNVNDLNEAFSLVKGQPIPGAHKTRSLGLSERSEFNSFMEKDIFANVANAASSAARIQAHEKYVGKDGSKVAAMLVKAVEEGMPLQEAATMGRRIKDYLDADSGNYKRPTSEVGKRLVAFQKNFVFLTTVTSLWKATVSSLPELALITRSLEPGDISKIKSEVEGYSKSMMGTINKEAGSREAQDAAYEALKSSSKQALRDLGFYDWDVGAATTTGVTEVSELKQIWMKRFFKANGLSQYTDMTRAARVSFAGDYIFNNITTIINSPEGKQTNEVMEAKEKLRNLGMDMTPIRLRGLRELMATDPELLTPEAGAALDNALRDATYNFINEAIVLPTAGNRPLIYSDPRFALFTQFQGFMATFTSTSIPKLWNDMVGRGSPAMQYNAFATMASMIALGFLSQAIKDQMNFGEDSPYLDENEKIRRGIESSGLLGTAGRITDTLFPLYEQQSSGPASWAWKQIESQSPALSKATQALGLSGNAIQGEKDAGGLISGAIKLGGIPTKGVTNSWNYLTK